MPQFIDPLKSPFGLSGGIILSGSQNVNTDGFWYYPIISSTAQVFTNNLDGSGTSGSISSGSVTATFAAGIGMYGQITAVSQSAGLSIVYYGNSPIRYTK